MSPRRGARAKVVRRRFLRVAVVLVGTLALVLNESVPAFASGLTPDGPDGSGNYSECAITYQAVPYSTSGTYAADFGSLGVGSGVYGAGVSSADLDPFVYGLNVAMTCNTAWTTGADNTAGYSQYVYGPDHIIGEGTMVAGVGSGGTQYDCSGGTCTWTETDGTDNAEGESVYMYCLDPSIEDQSWFSSVAYPSQLTGQECGAGMFTCATQSNAVSYGTETQCSVVSHTEVADVVADPPSSPSSYWTGETPSVPATPVPVVTCAADLDQTHQTAELTAGVSPLTGVTDTYSWDPGDSSGDIATATATHNYSSDGPFTATVTVTATGDGTDYTGTNSATCEARIDFVSGSSGASPGGGSGSTTPGAPTSCGITDFLCDLESAAAWLVIPGSSFYSSWSGFVTVMETKVPFAYVTGAAEWMETVATDMHSEGGGSGYYLGDSCFTLWPDGTGAPGAGTGDDCVTPPSGLVGPVHDAVDALLLGAVVLGLWGGFRKIIGEH